MSSDKWYFKHEYYGDDWQSFESTADDYLSVAEQIAEEDWNDEPCDPSDYEFQVQVRKGENGKVRTFKVLAEAHVYFFGSEEIE